MHSYSQHKQDIWVASIFPKSHQGFFFDMGAGDGVTFSNTKALEDERGWTGLLVEPHPAHYTELLANRPNCSTCQAIVDGTKGEVEYWFRRGWISGIVDHDTKQGRQRFKHKLHRDRQRGCACTAPARTLESVFEEFQVPAVVDYLSLDVEGAEYRILKTFPFDRWKFLTATIEGPTAKLDRLLQDCGYHHVASLGEDFCYVHSDLA